MTAPDPTPLDLDAIRADMEYAGSGIDGADLPYHPHALAAMRAAETLLAEVDRLRAEHDALDAVPPWETPDTERARLLLELAQACGERDTALAENERLRAVPDEAVWDFTHLDMDAVAKLFHDHYERLAPKYGYETREASANPWDQVPDNNRALMVDTVKYVMADLSPTRTARTAELEREAAADDDLRTELARTTARRDEIWRQFLALDRELAARDKAQANVRASVAEEIAVAIEEQDARGYAMYEAAYRESAEIAREHATPPEPLTLGPVGTVMLALADEGFHEDDEPAGDVVAAFETGVRRLTAPPTLDGPSTRAEGTHHYLSTACYHGHHNQCRQTCKFCPAECRCTCHPLPRPGADEQRTEPERQPQRDEVDPGRDVERGDREQDHRDEQEHESQHAVGVPTSEENHG